MKLKVGFLDSHYALTDIFYDINTDSYKYLNDIEPGLSIDNWANWTIEDEHARMDKIWMDSHQDGVHYANLGYRVYVKLLECPVNQILAGNDPDTCANITPDDVNILHGFLGH